MLVFAEAIEHSGEAELVGILVHAELAGFICLELRHVFAGVLRQVHTGDHLRDMEVELVVFALGCGWIGGAGRGEGAVA